MIKKPILLSCIFVASTLFASDFNSIEADRERTIIMEKTLSFLIADFQTLQKNIATLKVKNKLFKEKLTNINANENEVSLLKDDIKALKAQNKQLEVKLSDMKKENKQIAIKSFVTTGYHFDTFKIKEDYTPAFDQNNIDSEIIKLYSKDDMITAKRKDDVWYVTADSTFIKTKHLRMIKNEIK
ncbi:MAG: hypothetical protein DRG78_02365 [Epsilonproteobacteria bacterium]|nr:MAG: hypothetical protein DRG78_02365 [Campylobacterota bacterium]